MGIEFPLNLDSKLKSNTWPTLVAGRNLNPFGTLSSKQKD